MSGPEHILDRLDKVQSRGPGSWIARCPSHDDRSPSLSVRECQDGTILVKCFGGCSAADVVGALGFELKDLFPAEADYTQPHKPRRKPPISTRDLLRAMRHQLLIVAIAAEQLARGEALFEADRDALDAACCYFYELLREVEDVI